MGQEEENIAILEELYGIWTGTRAGTVENVLDHIAEDVTWLSLADGSPGMEFTASCSCKDDVIHYLSELMREWSMDFFELDEMIAEKDRVVVLSNVGWTNNRTGKSVKTPKADVFRIKDRLIVEYLEFYDTAAALAAARSE